MQIQEIDLDLIRKELEQGISDLQSNIFENNENASKLREILENLLKERKILIDSLEMYKTRNYAYHGHYIGKNDSNILYLSNYSIDFVNRLNYLSKKLITPIHDIINKIIYFFNNRLQNIPNSFPVIKSESFLGKYIFESTKFTISHINELVVNKSDINLPGYKFNFRNIELLMIYNIDKLSFNSNINSINNCETVFIPDNIPKLNVYAKCNKINNLRLYDSTLSLEFLQNISNV